jgi:Methylamine utilisation protein MauE
MGFVVWIVRGFLIATWGLAVTSKARSRDDFTDLESFVATIGVGQRFAKSVSLMLVCAEVLAVALLLFDTTAAWGLTASAALLTTFAIVTARLKVSGVRVGCRCFGANGSELGSAHIARDLALALLAAGTAVAAFRDHTVCALSGLGLVAALIGCVSAIVAVSLTDLVALLRSPASTQVSD